MDYDDGCVLHITPGFLVSGTQNELSDVLFEGYQRGIIKYVRQRPYVNSRINISLKLSSNSLWHNVQYLMKNLYWGILEYLLC